MKEGKLKKLFNRFFGDIGQVYAQDDGRIIVDVSIGCRMVLDENVSEDNLDLLLCAVRKQILNSIRRVLVKAEKKRI